MWFKGNLLSHRRAGRQASGTRAANADARRIVARGVLSLTVPCAVLMGYWQIIPERRWIRLDIANIALLCFVSYGMFLQSDLQRRRET
jgi:hypothetical protein